MCGIAGAIGNISTEVTQAVDRMSAAQIHRGPDGHGTWSSLLEGFASNGVVLAHRRLAIIDLSDAGAQPMVDFDTGNVVCFNGEIYNFKTIRTELENRHAVRFQSFSDTEVILKSYAVWGIDCVERFRGMFAFAIYDKSQDVVHLVRDRVGVKPLYWTSFVNSNGKEVVLFASELRAILASNLVPRRLDPVGVSTYLWNGFVQGPNTIIQNIHLLDQGSILSIDVKGMRKQHKGFWTLPTYTGDGVTDVTAVGTALEEAVKLRLISDVPLGIFLSGGIDSSAVASIAAKSVPGKIQTFNVAFAEQEFDESHFARLVAKSIGAEHTELTLTEEMFHENLDHATDCLDQPSFDAINSYFVSRAVRDAGIKVALAGTGGDELFGGYASFLDIPKALRLSRNFFYLPKNLRTMLLEICMRWINRGTIVPRQNRWGKLRDLIETEGHLDRVYQVSYALFTREFLLQLCNGLGTNASWGLCKPRNTDETDGERSKDSCSNIHAAISKLEMNNFVGQRLVRDVDCASMAVSLEVREPMLDHELIQEITRVEPSRRFYPIRQKSLLREIALSNLDPSIFNRPKSGFVLPLENWLKNTLRDRVESIFQDRQLSESVGLETDALNRLFRAFITRNPDIHWSRVWALYVLMRWAKQHNAHL
jgi:asparagine synthase (glutamine-hydrolysing)